MIVTSKPTPRVYKHDVTGNFSAEGKPKFNLLYDHPGYTVLCKFIYILLPLQRGEWAISGALLPTSWAKHRVYRKIKIDELAFFFKMITEGVDCSFQGVELTNRVMLNQQKYI